MISRYTRPEMGRIWDLENRYAKWLKVEIAACEAMAEEGLVPMEALKTIKEKAGFSVEKILEIEETTKHDVIAFLTNVEEYVGPDSRYIHLGLTSSDVLDTSLEMVTEHRALREMRFVFFRFSMAFSTFFQFVFCVRTAPIIISSSVSAGHQFRGP